MMTKDPSKPRDMWPSETYAVGLYDPATRRVTTHAITSGGGAWEMLERSSAPHLLRFTKLSD